jgi:CrcB protein
VNPRQPERPGEPSTVDDDPELPFDPDVDTAEDRRHHPAAGSGVSPFPPPRRSRWPRIRPAIVGAVAGGGFFGGLVRYLVGLALPAAPGGYPWATLIVNTAGAFILALLLILVLEVLPPTTYLRPVLGTGFCGALTTFSSVATGVDQLVAHGHAATAAVYVAISLLAGLAAASLGVVLGRALAGDRGKGRE